MVVCEEGESGVKVEWREKKVGDIKESSMGVRGRRGKLYGGGTEAAGDR